MICVISRILTIRNPTVCPSSCICQKNVSVLIMALSCNRRMTCAIQRISCRIKICHHIYFFSICCHCWIDKCCGISIPNISIISKIISESIMPCFSFVCRTRYDCIQSTAVSTRIPSGIASGYQCAVIKRHETWNSKPCTSSRSTPKRLFFCCSISGLHAICCHNCSRYTTDRQNRRQQKCQNSSSFFHIFPSVCPKVILKMENRIHSCTIFHFVPYI